MLKVDSSSSFTNDQINKVQLSSKGLVITNNCTGVTFKKIYWKFQLYEIAQNSNKKLSQFFDKHFWDLTPNDDCEPSASRRVQERYQVYGLGIASDVLAVQKLLKDEFSALTSAEKGGTSSASL